MVIVAVIVTSVLLSFYLVLIFYFRFGWKKIPLSEELTTFSMDWRISVVICCKNEALHLPYLIESLKHQRFKQFELIWVNDHSIDETQEIMESSIPFFEHVQIIQGDAKGKKQALKAGILAASGNLIVTTDADCTFCENWLSAISDFQEQNAADLIIAPVKYNKGTTLFETIQQLEFACLVGSGMGAAGAKMPILCNAANMAFTKKAWLDSVNDLHEEEISGDDIFLLLSIKKRKGKIAILKSHNAMVVTEPKRKLSTFTNQRRRWASKSSKYTDVQIISTGIIVAGINLLLLSLLVLAFFSPQCWYVLITVFLIKLINDYSFLKLIQPLFLFNLNGLNVILLSMFYPFYVLMIGLSTLVNRRQHWK